MRPSISRILQRHLLHELLNTFGHTGKCDVTAWIKRSLIAALKLEEHLIRPTTAPSIC